jgi:SnoaL-like domain
MTIKLTGVVADHIAAVNTLDTDAIVATFAQDAYVNDNRREFNGSDAIRRWVAKEMVGDHVTIEVREVIDHYGDTIVRGAYNGTYDKANLPDELILSNYASLTARLSASSSSSISRPRTDAANRRGTCRAP